jgi:enoyl-CoA hydratase/carnithine racemase
MNEALAATSALRGGRNVIFYASAFLQKPQAPPNLIQLTAEELNGLMSVIYGMKWNENLTLLLHTPGGQTNAAESFVEYLCSKFADIEVVVPAMAMSAGTMISLAASRIVMGRQSQLGPIDPQIPLPTQGRFVSARAIVEQFDAAKRDVVPPDGDLQRAHVWAPVLQSLGPALLQEAENALSYGESMVARWLKERMFSEHGDSEARGAAAAAHFNDASTHKSHGRRIDRAEARHVGLVVEDLEDSQELQEAVLTAYHLVTLFFEQTMASKILWSHHGRAWVKNFAQ